MKPKFTADEYIERQYKQKHIYDQISLEIIEATEKFGAMKSFHEGYAIIKEEFEEFWESIKNNEDPEVIKGELLQVGAMVFRFLLDLLGDVI